MHCFSRQRHKRESCLTLSASSCVIRTQNKSDGPGVSGVAIGPILCSWLHLRSYCLSKGLAIKNQANKKNPEFMPSKHLLFTFIYGLSFETAPSLGNLPLHKLWCLIWPTQVDTSLQASASKLTSTLYT